MLKKLKISLIAIDKKFDDYLFIKLHIFNLFSIIKFYFILYYLKFVIIYVDKSYNAALNS